MLPDASRIYLKLLETSRRRSELPKASEPF